MHKVDMSSNLPYDPKDPKSIEGYAKLLLNRSLNQTLGGELKQLRKGKGRFGQMVEEAYFRYTPNSDASADFKQAGVELKTTPLKKASKGFSAKERLSLNMIDFNEDYKLSFVESHFWKKNKLWLLMFYLYDKEKLDIDYIFKIIRLWRFPAADLKIVKDDFTKIINKIKAGKAHELSEGDTLYLGACTKGMNKTSVQAQPFSAIPAKRRAFSLKQKYLNFIVQKSLSGDDILSDETGYDLILNEPINFAAEPSEIYRKKLLDVDPVVKDIADYRQGETFEDLIIRKFSPYYGMSENELEKKLSIVTKAKNKFQLISNAILGVKTKKIEEFEKADVIMRNIRMEGDGHIKENMSFRQIQYEEIVGQDWEDSTWYEELNRRFFFVIFRRDSFGVLRLKKVMFWTMPASDLDLARLIWLDTQKKIVEGDFEHFIKSKDNPMGHVRPKGKDGDDKMMTQAGKMEKKKCFWLHAKYISSIVA